MFVTAVGLVAFFARIITTCVLRRRHDLMPFVVAYAWAIAVTWLLSFVVLRGDTFY
jgi:hypothetical protein